jgi:hypothetical protein
MLFYFYLLRQRKSGSIWAQPVSQPPDISGTGVE